MKKMTARAAVCARARRHMVPQSCLSVCRFVIQWLAPWLWGMLSRATFCAETPQGNARIMLASFGRGHFAWHGIRRFRVEVTGSIPNSCHQTHASPTIAAQIITYTILGGGVPYYNHSIIGTQTLFYLLRALYWTPFSDLCNTQSEPKAEIYPLNPNLPAKLEHQP